MDAATRLREEAHEHERIAYLEREEARIDHLIAAEEIRRANIARRLEIEIRRLRGFERAH
jgi:hypothetical protein